MDGKFDVWRYDLLRRVKYYLLRAVRIPTSISRMVYIPSISVDESSKCRVIVRASEETVQHGGSNVDVFCGWGYHVLFCWCKGSVNLAVTN